MKAIMEPGTAVGALCAQSIGKKQIMLLFVLFNKSIHVFLK